MSNSQLKKNLVFFIRRPSGTVQLLPPVALFTECSLLFSNTSPRTGDDTERNLGDCVLHGPLLTKAVPGR